jgi:hypothetical protein
MTTQLLLEDVNNQVQELGPFKGEVSDGYHTFDELYEHRITLYIALCKILAQIYNNCSEGLPWCYIWRSKIHSDGSEWPGWFLLGINYQQGNQITYHLPLGRWEETNFAKDADIAPPFDGHTSSDVLDRLKNIL